MELKCSSAGGRTGAFHLLIAPLMELKYLIDLEKIVDHRSFNRTAYGIEIDQAYPSRSARQIF